MKKTIITSLVALAALGFSGTSFAQPPQHNEDPAGINVIDNEVDLDFDLDLKDESVNADHEGPAAGDDIGQVAYDAPAVGNDMIRISAEATAIQKGDAILFPDLKSIDTGSVEVESGLASVSPQHHGPQPEGVPGSASADNATTGNVSFGDITVDLSNVASAIAIGGGGSYSPTTETTNNYPAAE